MLNLKAKTDNEKIVLDYLNKNVNEVLAEKINSGEKTLAQCWNYITSEAKKLAKNGCACVDDATVFGWAVHFFEEDSIEAKQPATPCEVKTMTEEPQAKEEPPKPTPTKKKTPKVEPTDTEQIFLF